jgi:KipI family sensor histidine kinase inhibitor
MSVADSFMPERGTIVPLGDNALLVRFGTELDEGANRRAVSFALALRKDVPSGVVEIVPSLVSVLVRYDPWQIDPVRLAGELSLRMTAPSERQATATHRIAVRFDGPDLGQVAQILGFDIADFVTEHNKVPLRVLTTGFAPGFVYCGFHRPGMIVPRRAEVRPHVPAGSVLFAAGQTAIAATDIPTGWHVIGQTDFRNFDLASLPPTRLVAGDTVWFEAVP